MDSKKSRRRPMKYLVAWLATAFVASSIRADDPPSAAAKAFQVPYRLTATNHVMVRAKINGKGPFNFILDTGAPTLFVATAVARKLSVVANDNGWGTFDRVEIEGGVVLEKCRGRIEDPFQLEGMNGLGLAGLELHGIIGYTVLARYRLGFDFTKHKMTWEPLNFKPPPPQGMEGPGGPSGMEAFGAIMKLVGAFLGKGNGPDIRLRGFWGVVLEESQKTVVIKKIFPSGPAAEVGLEAGDRILRLGGKPMHSVADVQQEAAKTTPGEALDIEIER